MNYTFFSSLFMALTLMVIFGLPRLLHTNAWLELIMGGILFMIFHYISLGELLDDGY